MAYVKGLTLGRWRMLKGVAWWGPPEICWTQRIRLVNVLLLHNNNTNNNIHKEMDKYFMQLPLKL